jgi:hypothetical protein
MSVAMTNVDKDFPKGLLRPQLFMGIISSINAQTIRVNLSEAGNPSGSHFSGGRYGKGEVGEFVLIEGQLALLLGRVVEVRLPESERRLVSQDYYGSPPLDAIGQIQLLGSVGMDDLHVTAGIEAYPRLGDRVYAAPHKFVSRIPILMEQTPEAENLILLTLGSVDVAQESKIYIKPEKLFGRHCAILGATGGGKSWTTARIIEECLKHKSKIILLDATGEYRDFSGNDVVHCQLGDPVEKATDSISRSLPPTSFIESDFVALFEPAGKVQGPKLRAAIRSLRLAKLRPALAPDGFIKKIDQQKALVLAAEKEAGISIKLDDPNQEFDVNFLVKQIEQECVYPDGFGQQRGQKDISKWGGEGGDFSYCLSLVSRIYGVLISPAFNCVFGCSCYPLTQQIDEFMGGDEKLLRICLSGIAYEFNAREIIANVIGRFLISKARNRAFIKCPVVVIVDEAHNFLGRHIGSEDYATRLDAFEIIAKEGRKYSLSICLATQRPRDITEGALSQMGTLIVHRLTNDRDREVVEKACGEIDRSASAFLPNLKPGEAAIIGADFPIPLTIQIEQPTTKPKSDGPNFQQHWKIVI